MVEKDLTAAGANIAIGDANADANADANGVENGVESKDSAVLAKKLLSAGGVVAVKLAQMLAEDPKIPKEYRELLGSLRDEYVT